MFCKKLTKRVWLFLKLSYLSHIVIQAEYFGARMVAQTEGTSKIQQATRNVLEGEKFKNSTSNYLRIVLLWIPWDSNHHENNGWQNITTIVYLRVLIIQIGSTIILMVVEAQGIQIRTYKTNGAVVECSSNLLMLQTDSCVKHPPVCDSRSFPADPSMAKRKTHILQPDSQMLLNVLKRAKKHRFLPKLAGLRISPSNWNAWEP